MSANYATADGTAFAGSDYVASSGTVTFEPGEVTKTIEVQVNGDTAPEGDETFGVLLSFLVNAAMADDEARVTITNDDLPTLYVNDVRVNEGNAGAAQAVFVVSLPGLAPGTVSVNFSTADGTASAGSDYEAVSGTLVFAPGETSKTVSVPVHGDAALEPDETFTLTLSSPVGAAISDGQGVATIVNDDQAAPPAPRVAAVFVGSSGWSAAFRSALAAAGLGEAGFGCSVPAGPGQLATLPWANLDQIAIRFDQGVSVDPSDLAVRGVDVPAYPVRAFSYDAQTRTATWTLAQPLPRDKVLLDLDGDPPGGAVAVASAAGLLDGEWANGSAAQVFPSGDGTAGGDFEFRLNALTGDADRSARVNALDLWQVRRRLRTSTTRPGSGTYRYSVFNDVSGDGRIDSRDLLAVRRDQFQSLPPGDPSGAGGAAAQAKVASVTNDLLFSSAPILA